MDFFVLVGGVYYHFFFSKFQHRLFTLRIITCIAKHIADVYISSKSDLFFFFYNSEGGGLKCIMTVR